MEKQKILDELWDALCKISGIDPTFRNLTGVCQYLTTVESINFFTELFEPKTDRELMVRLGGHWMIYESEYNHDELQIKTERDAKRIQERRFMACLMTYWSFKLYGEIE